MPVTVQRQVRSFFGMSSTPCRGADADSHGPSVQKNHRDSPDAVHSQGDRYLLCRSAVRAQCGDSRDPTVAARFFSDQVVDIPVVSTTGAGVEVQKTATVPQLQHIRQGGRYPCWRSSSTRYGSPVTMQRRQVSCWRCLRFDSVHRQSWWTFSCAAENGTRLGGYGGGEGAFLMHFASFFALLRLSQS